LPPADVPDPEVVLHQEQVGIRLRVSIQEAQGVLVKLALVQPGQQVCCRFGLIGSVKSAEIQLVLIVKEKISYT
jgi:hypothetical protein